MRFNLALNINPFQIFQTLRFGAFILISIFLAKFNLGTNLIGSYEYVLMLGGAAAFFWLGGYLTAYLSKSAATENKNSNWLSNVFYCMLFYNLVVIAVMLGLFFSCPKSVFDKIELNTFFLFLIYHFLNNTTYLNEHYLLARNQNRLLIHYGIINFFLLIMGALGGLELLHGLNGILAGLIFASFLKLLFTLFFLKQEKAFQLPESRLWKAFMWQGALISVSILLGSLGDYLDEYLVRFFYGNSVFAVYKMGAREFPLLNILSNSLASILIILVAKEGIENCLTEFKQKTANLIRVLTPLMCVVVLSGKWLFPFFYNEQFSQSAVYFNLYALLCFSKFLFPQSIIIGLQLNRYLIWASVAETILHVALSLLLISSFGVYGIIAGFLISSMLDKILLAFFIYRKTKKSIWNYTPIIEYVLGNFMIIASIIIASVW
jgi:O-antigen/teichoic acid export membrane protein